MTVARTDRRVAWALAVAVAVLVALDALLGGTPAPRSPWHRIPGYSALIAFVACIVAVALAKGVGKAFLQRPVRDDD